jgi:hypothetical protein
MKLTFAERVTLDGLTYLAGEHDVDDDVASRLLHNHPDSISEARSKPAPKPKAKPKKKIFKKDEN